MLEKINLKIGRFLLNRKYLKTSKNVQSFNNFFSKSRDILILMPLEDTGFSYAEKFICNLIEMNYNVTIFIPHHKINLIQNKSSYKIIDFNITDVNKFGLPNKNYLKNLHKEEFDIIMDLSFKESNFLLSILFEMKTKFRVGFTKRDSDVFYNFQSGLDEKKPEISFGNLLNSLKMF